MKADGQRMEHVSACARASPTLRRAARTLYVSLAAASAERVQIEICTSVALGVNTNPQISPPIAPNWTDRTNAVGQPKDRISYAVS